MKSALRLLVFILPLCLAFNAIAQTCNSPAIKSKIDYINSLGYQKQITRGYALSDSIINSLRKSKDTACYNFYKLIYAKGILHIRNDKYGEAIVLFTDLISKLETTKYKDIEAQSYLSLALINELLGRVQFCKDNIDAANLLIQKHNLKEPLTRYFVRYASYYRVLLGQRDSCYFLAKKAIESIQPISDVKDIGDSYFLIAACGRNQAEKDSFRNKAIDIYYKSDDIIASLFLSFRVHEDLLKAGRYEEALTYLENLKVKYIDALKENSLEQHTVMNYYYKQKKEEALRLKDYPKAIEYGELYISNVEKMAEMKNEIKISKLQEEFLYEKEQKKSQALKEKSDNLTKLLYVSLLVLAILSVLLYLIIDNRKKLKKQKEVIETSMIAVKNLNHKNELLLSEVHHRVKNSLQNVISILQIKKEKTSSFDVKEILIDISNRVNCISLIHEQLYQNEEYENINAYSYINNILSLHSQISNQNQSHFFTVAVDKNLILNIDTMMPIGIIVNELITNSIKHANTQSNPLKINISINKLKSNNYQFEYSDNGVINNENKTNTGLGKILISSMVKQLNSTYEIITDNGYRISFEFKEKATSEV